MSKNHPDRAEIDRQIDMILSLKEARAKDGVTPSAALKALGRGKLLFEELCQWAVKDYVSAHASAGCDRKMLAKLLPLTSICPRVHELALALRALDLGQVQEIVKPIGGRHGKAFDLAILRLGAIKYIEYHRTLGTKKHILVAHVANMYGCTPDAVLQWEKTYLPDTLGRDDLALAKAAAQWNAKQAAYMRFRQPNADSLRALEERYGNEQLAHDGQEHRTATAKAKKAKVTKLKPRRR